MQNKNNKYTRIGMGIIIPLNYKDYQVRANTLLINKEPNIYELTLEIGTAGIANWYCIDGDVFTLTPEKNVNMKTVNFVMDKFVSGYFKPFIDNYEDELKASQIGFEILEKERLGIK